MIILDTVIANKYNDVLSSLNIEVSKKIQGVFTVDEIIKKFGNFFFNRMFLDITAIDDYKNIANLQKLSMNINMDKVILPLDKDDQISDSQKFLSKLVSIGIYNFTKDKNSLMHLYKHPNIYRDVAYLQDLEDDDSGNIPSDNSAAISQTDHRYKILGIKNVTDSAGATTLVYLLRKVLNDYYRVMSLELNKRDFTYLKDKDSLSIKENELNETLAKYSAVDIFIIDLNKSKCEDICTDVLYLIEPSTIKLNELVLINNNIFIELKDKKVILNKSLLNEEDIADFEIETDLKIYYNIPPLNDKKDCSNILLPLLEKLGYIKEIVGPEKQEKKINKLFNLFK